MFNSSLCFIFSCFIKLNYLRADQFFLIFIKSIRNLLISCFMRLLVLLIFSFLCASSFSNSIYKSNVCFSSLNLTFLCSSVHFNTSRLNLYVWSSCYFLTCSFVFNCCSACSMLNFRLPVS